MIEFEDKDKSDATGGCHMSGISLNSAYSQFSSSGLPQAIGIMMLSKAKESAELQGAQMVQMMQQSVQPHLGGNLDIRV